MTQVAHTPYNYINRHNLPWWFGTFSKRRIDHFVKMSGFCMWNKSTCLLLSADSVVSFRGVNFPIACLSNQFSFHLLNKILHSVFLFFFFQIVIVLLIMGEFQLFCNKISQAFLTQSYFFLSKRYEFYA